MGIYKGTGFAREQREARDFVERLHEVNDTYVDDRDKLAVSVSPPTAPKPWVVYSYGPSGKRQHLTAEGGWVQSPSERGRWPSREAAEAAGRVAAERSGGLPYFAIQLA